MVCKTKDCIFNIAGVEFHCEAGEACPSGKFGDGIELDMTEYDLRGVTTVEEKQLILDLFPKESAGA